MKYITTLKALLLIGALTGCQPQEELTIDSRTMTFNVALEGEKSIQTRAYAGDLDLAAKGFTLVGYKTVGGFTAEPGSAVPNVLSTSAGITTNVASITRNATSGKFTIKLPTIGGSSDTEANEQISYFAWSGEKETGNYGLLDATKDGMAGYPFIDVKLRRADAAQKDIVVAHAINFPNDYVVTAVDLDFHHLFSKLTFSVKNSTQAKVTVTGAKLKFAKDAVYSKARYTYDCSDSIGAFSRYTDYHAEGYFTPNDWKTNLAVANSIGTLGNLLILPQKATTGFLTLELTYTLASGDVTSTITRTVGLNGLDLRQGKNYLYTLNIHAEEVEVINATVGKWNEAPTGSLPLVPGPCGDDILLLEGTDAPYPYDGKWYWLDRSGYNNHCELIEKVTGSIEYSEVNKAYSVKCPDTDYLNGTVTNFIKIPQLGYLTSSTVEMVITPNIASANVKWSQTPLTLSCNPITTTMPGWNSSSPSRDWMVHIYENDQVVFDYGGNSSTLERLRDGSTNFANKRTTKAFFAFRRGPYLKTITRNNNYFYSAQSLSDDNIRQKSLASKEINVTNGAIGPLFNGGLIHYIKITKKCLTVEQTFVDFEDLKQKSAYDIPEDDLTTIQKNYLPPVRAGLILCLDGRAKSSPNSWADLSGSENTASVFAKYSSSSSADQTLNGVTFSGGVLFKLSKSLGAHQEMTLEAYITPNDATFPGSTPQGNTLLAFFPPASNNDSQQPETARQVHVHAPWAGTIAFSAPADKNRLNYSYSNGYSKHHYCFKRAMTSNGGATLTLWLDNRLVQTAIFDSPATVQELKNCYIGGQNATTNSQYFSGIIHVIRFYNRALSPEEQTKNYEYDKAAFGAP